MLKLSTFQIILLTVFGSLGVAGIMIFALIQANVGGTTIGPVVIWGTLEETEIRTSLRSAADEDQRFAEVTYVKKDAVDYDAELKDALASGKGPDLFIMRTDHAVRDATYAIHIPYAQLSESQFKGTFLDAAEPFLAEDGVVAVPILVDPLVLFWNKDALATAGIAAPPQYWDQVPSMVEKLVKKSDSGTVEKGGIAFGSYDNIPAAKDILATLVMQAGGAITGKDNAGKLRPLLATQGGTTLSVTALNYYTEFADPSQPDYSWSKAFKNAEQAFAAADVAMYVGHASDMASITALNPNLHFEMARLPQIRTSTYALNTADVYGLALSRASKNARGAITVAYLLAAPEITSPIAKSLGMVSALRRVLSPNTAPAANPSANEQIDALQGLVSGTAKTEDSLLSYEANISRAWLDPDPDKTGLVFRDMIENTVSGALKASEAVQRADKQINEVLNN